jgi:ATPase family associated with various cellular activities (AAA)
MATAVLYEEDISLPADQSDRTGDLPEVDVATSALSPTATTKPSPAAPALSGFIQTWAEQRPMLAKQVHDTGIEVAAHTGTKEFDAYVEGSEGQALMHDLTTVAFYGVQRSLADHWGLIFTGRMPAAMMKDFVAQLRVEIAIPVIENARASDPLQALVIQSSNTKTTHVRTTYSQFKAQDARFEVSRPVVFLYWRDDLWSLIIPGRNIYQQFGGFQYTDNKGKVSNSGEVISKVFLANLRRPSVVEKFAQLDQAFDRLRAHGKVVNLHRRLEKQLAALDRKIAAWSKVFLPEKQMNEVLQRANMFEVGDKAAPRGLLLTGPPGTGKTQIARTLANESGLGFLAATTADVKANFLGQSGNRVKQLFERARANTPVILFLDELDIIAPARTGGNDALTDEIVGQLLQELDGIQSRDSEVFLLAATNHAEQIDRAVLSRFQERLAIPLPDLHGRERLLTVLLQKKRLTFALEEGSHTLAAMSEGRGMSGRDLKSWIGRAEQKALLRAIATGGPQHFALKLDDFDSPVTETTVTG